LAVAIASVEAKGFLKPAAESTEHVSEEDIQASLLEELEGTLGAGAATSRVRLLEAILKPMYAAMPKNEHGNLGHATVRYALHRLFLVRHGWNFKGLNRDAEAFNVTSPAGVLKDQMPAYIQTLFENRLDGKGLSLHDLAAMAATMEHLVHKEVVGKLGDTYALYNILPTQPVSDIQADRILDLIMASRVYGQDIKKLNQRKAATVLRKIPDDYIGWDSTQKFVRRVKSNLTMDFQNSTPANLDFATMTKIAEVVGEEFGNVQSFECEDLKTTLMKMDPRGSGRIRLGDFYQPGLDGNWQFQEKPEYLRQIGALDESDPTDPSVVMVNYIHSYANCIISAGFYNVCCKDECEGLFGHLEDKIAAPEATPKTIVALVSKLPSSTVQSPRHLSATLLSRLDSIAEEHGGTVPLHGRLFAQWMHHAYPRECPYPHVTGASNQQTPAEWKNITGMPERATRKEMQKFIPSSENGTWNEESEELPWTPEEELLVVRPMPQPLKTVSFFATLRPIVLLVAAGSFAFSLFRSFGAVSLSGNDSSNVKFIV
jgi:hypothetical protein